MGRNFLFQNAIGYLTKQNPTQQGQVNNIVLVKQGAGLNTASGLRWAPSGHLQMEHARQERINKINWSRSVASLPVASVQDVSSTHKVLAVICSVKCAGAAEEWEQQ